MLATCSDLPQQQLNVTNKAWSTVPASLQLAGVGLITGKPYAEVPARVVDQGGLVIL
jgi:hypothetical protein